MPRYILITILLVLIPYSRAAAVVSSRVPVVLVHGLASEPVHAWGAPGDGGGEPRYFYRFLVDNGYEPGKHLFTVDYSDMNNGDYAVIFKDRLMRVIDQARRASGSTRVDVVAHSMGGLVARYYLNTPYYRDDVRTLVMLGTPNHGSFGANILKLMNQMWKHRADSRVRASYPEEPGNMANLPFQDEFSYVSRRAKVFEPLYLQYSLESRFLATGRSRGRPVPFEAWLAEHYPDLYRRCFLEAQEPPLDPEYVREGPGKPPATGQDLTRAYYELLALNVGRNNVLLRQGASYGTVLVGLVVNRVDPLLKVKADGVAIDRLLEEYVEVPRPGRGYSRVGYDYDRVKANFFLNYWNDVETARRLAREERRQTNVKYVVVAGKMFNLWSPLYQTVGDNDIIVEVDSTFLPLRDNDVFALYSGLYSPNHFALRRNREIYQLVLQELRDYLPAARRYSPRGRKKWWQFWSWEIKGEGRASYWRPRYIEFDDRALLGVTGELEIEFEAPRLRGKDRGKNSPGYKVWLYKETAAGELEREEAVLRAGWRKVTGSVRVGGFGKAYRRAWLGVRLQLPETGPGKLVNLYRQPLITYSYRARVVPPVEAGNATGDFPAVSGRRDPGDPPSVTPPPVPGGDSGPARPGEGRLPGPVVVKRKSKQTTLQKEDRTYHARWEWDFGDGTRQVDEDPTRVLGEATHFFSAPGKYGVTAVSYSNKGEVLRKGFWEVEIREEEQLPVPRHFTLETIQEPGVKIRLEGPRKWITGRPALFRVEVEVDPVPFMERQVVSVDPGRLFAVEWERPGTFEVAAAVTIRTTYRLPERTLTIANTYVERVQVKVATTALSD